MADALPNSLPDPLAGDVHGSEVGARRASARANGSVARARIERLVDPGSFQEIGQLAMSVVRDQLGRIAGCLPGGTVCGLAGIDGRLVAVAAEGPVVEPNDEPLPVRKLAQPKSGWDGYIERLALDHEIPLVLLLDGWGGGNSSTGRKDYSFSVSAVRTLASLRLLDVAPVAVGVLGPVAGLAAARVVAAHFSVMLRSTGRVFAGSALESGALAGDLAASLGGATLQAGAAGNVDNVAETEDDLYDQIRAFLSFLPSNSRARPPFEAADDDPNRSCDGLAGILPDNPKAGYNVVAIIDEIVDDGSFFELTPRFGAAVITGLARMGGEPVGVIASNPLVLAGAMDAAACEKTTRMFELCDTFHLPVVSFSDVPGLMIGPDAERTGLFRRGFRTMQAAHRATVPVFTVIVRRSYGVGGMLTGSPRANGHILSWPRGEWGDMPIEGGAAALYGRELAAAADPETLLIELEARLKSTTSLWSTAEAFGIGDVIEPSETRRILCRLIAAAVAHRPHDRKRGPSFRP
ncbi:MAG TPA: carboxyl transferase domain-containing protein [Ilumatobacteraceae bacterium]